ncbi:MAG: hypothetical protein ACK4SM_06820 [Aquificaceae bacterium]
MERIPSIEDRFFTLLKDFFKDIHKREPFAMELSQYKLNLKSKLLEIIDQFTPDYETSNKSFNSALEALDRFFSDSINKLDLENEKELKRYIQALEETNQVVKEFLYESSLKDKSVLSRVSGKIGEMVEMLSYQQRKRSSLFRKLKKALGL